jgi:hypothetical protein
MVIEFGLRAWRQFRKRNNGRKGLDSIRIRNAPSGSLWKNFAYIFSAQEYMDNIFHNDIAPKPSDAGDILQDKIKNPIRYGEFIPWEMIS